MRLSQEEMVWVYEQAKRHASLYNSKVYAEQAANNVLHAWQGLEKQLAFAIAGNAVGLTMSRNGLRVLRRYIINAISVLKTSIVPGYKKRLDLPGGERYLSYIQAAESKIERLLEPLLIKVERELE